jgi:hypothetical protein
MCQFSKAGVKYMRRLVFLTCQMPQEFFPARVNADQKQGNKIKPLNHQEVKMSVPH